MHGAVGDRLGTIMKSALLLATGVAAAACAVVPSAAADIAFSSSLISSSSPDFCVLGSCALQTSDSLNSYGYLGWEVGDSARFFLGDVNVMHGFGWDNDAGLELTLHFTQPDVATASTGALAQYIHAFGWIVPGVTGGSITWEENDFHFSVGSYDFELGLENVSGWNVGSPVPLYGTLQLSAVRPGSSDGDVGTTPVPEAASWLMMLGGFGLMGATLRAGRPAIALN